MAKNDISVAAAIMATLTIALLFLIRVACLDALLLFVKTAVCPAISLPK